MLRLQAFGDLFPAAVSKLKVDVQGCKDWSQAVEKALPQRKIKKAKREDSLASDEGVEPEQKMQRTSEE